MSAVQSTEIIPKQSNELEAQAIKTKNDSLNSNKVAEADYYSDSNEESEEKIEEIRMAQKRIYLGIIAFSFIGSLVILIVLVHIKSRRVSGLKHLM